MERLCARPAQPGRILSVTTVLLSLLQAFLLLAPLSGALQAQAPPSDAFTNRTTANGLGSNTVYKIASQPGAIYAATAGGLGISQNGRSFSNITTANGLGSNLVYDVIAAGTRVYAATDGGLSVSSDAGLSFSNRTTAHGLGGNQVTKIFLISGTLYAVTNGGLSVSTDNGNTFVNRTIANGLGSNSINDVRQEGSSLFVATTGGLSFSPPLSANTDLTALSLSSGTLTPAFSSTVTSYTTTVPASLTSITATPTAADPTAVIRVNGAIVASGTASGSIILSSSSTLVPITVTAPDGSIRTYSVNVRQSTLSSVNTLSALTLSSGTLSPAFASGTLSYSASVSNATASITITPTLTDASASVRVNGNLVSNGTASAPVSLTVGRNTINVAVTAQNGSVNTYALAVTRAASTVNTLSALALSSGTLTPAFSSTVLSYAASVANATASLTLTPTASTTLATVRVNGTVVPSGTASAPISLTVGSNTITVAVTAQSGSVRTYTVVVSRAGTSSVSTLSALSLSSGTLSPAFSSTVTAYSASVDNTTASLTLTPTVTDANATVQVNGVTVGSGTASAPISLTVGSNLINVVVTAQNGSTTTYAVNVNRAAPPLSGVNTLSALTLSSGTLSPAFASGTLSYSASVSNATASITITPTLTDASASVRVNGNLVSNGTASAPVSLTVGRNTINVAVTAQNGSVNTYALAVTRAASTVNTLSALALSSGTLSPVFSSTVLSYAASVANATSDITVTPTASTTLATVRVNGAVVPSGTASAPISLTVGSNTITVAVTAQSGSVRTYTVVVSRAGTSSVSTLSALSLSSGTLSPAFSSTVTAYSASVDNATASLTLTPTVTDANATVQVNGVTVGSGTASAPVNLTVGSNLINVVVTAQNGSTTTYAVNVNRAAPPLSGVNTLSALTLSSGTLSPAFASGTLSYSASVSNATTSITITPTLTDATASIQVNGTAVGNGTSSAPVNLTVGNNTLNVVVTAQNGAVNTYNLTISRAASGVNTLSALAVSSGTLNPAFASSTTSYTVSAPNSLTSVTFTPTVTDASATVRVNGTVVASGSASAPVSLTVGSNLVNVAVTAQNGSVNTYTVNVVRAVAIPSNALIALTTSSGTLSPTFIWSTLSYVTSVTATSLMLTPTANSAQATISVNGNPVGSGSTSPSLPLNIGSNTIQINVTATNGSVRTYTLTVHRTTANDARLSGLTLSSGTLAPAFDPAITDYVASVSSSTARISLTPSVANPAFTITVNGNLVGSGSASPNVDLNPGITTISVGVRAPDGSYTTYQVRVNRPAASNANLSALTISSGTLSPVFGAATPTYVASVSATTSSITISATAADANTRVNVNGLDGWGSSSAAVNLNVGMNDITVYAVAPDNSVRYYTVRINRPAASNDATLSALSLSGATITTPFSATTTIYASSVPAGTVQTTISVTTTDPGAQISGGGLNGTGSASTTVNLSPNQNNYIAFGVMARDGTNTNYNVWINRPASGNANLSGITLSAGTLSPTFSAATTSYVVSVPNATSSITITGAAADANAGVSVNGSGTASNTINLNEGANTAYIDVTAPDGSPRRYTVYINRASVLVFDQLSLTGLTISSGTLTPAFSSTTTSYVVNIAAGTSSITFRPTVANNATTSINVNNVTVGSGSNSPAMPLSVGENNATVLVFNPLTGASQAYSIRIIRPASSNANLSGLTLSSGALAPAFSSATRSYVAALPSNTGTITVTPTAADAGATIAVNGNTVSSGSASPAISINPGGHNYVSVVVTAPDGNRRSYDMLIDAIQPSDAGLTGLVLSSGTLSPAFSTGVSTYVASVASSTSSITVRPTAVSSTASLSVNGNPVGSGSNSPAIALNYGDNYIYVGVYMGWPGQRTYTIRVNRPAPSNVNLSGLTLSSGTLSPVFSAAVTSYVTTVDNSTSSITLTPTAADANATIYVNSSVVSSGSTSSAIALNIGQNYITVQVQTLDGTLRRYNLMVNRPALSNASLSNLTLSNGTLSPAFDGATASYVTSLTASSTRITPTAAGAGTTIYVGGNTVASGSASPSIALSAGANPITIQVYAQDGTYRIYNLLINRVPSLPAGGGRVAASAEPETPLQVTVLGNPVQQREVVVAVTGAGGKALTLQLYDATGRLAVARQVPQAGTSEEVRLRLSSADTAGVYLLRVSTPTQQQTVRVKVE